MSEMQANTRDARRGVGSARAGATARSAAPTGRFARLSGLVCSAVALGMALGCRTGANVSLRAPCSPGYHEVEGWCYPDSLLDAGAADGGESMPDSGRPTPDSAQPFPDSRQPFPDSAQPFPDSAQPFPDSAQPLPDGGAGTTADWSSLRDGLLVLMHFEDGPYAATQPVHDDSGHAHHGTVGSTPIQTVVGRIGSAAQMNDRTELLIPDHPELGGMTAISISLWFKAETVNREDWPGLISKRQAYGVDTAFAMYLNPEPGRNLVVDLAEESANRLATPLETSIGEWHHAAMVFDGSQVAIRTRVYLDGREVAMGANTQSRVPDSEAPLRLGDLPAGGARFNGLLDEVAIWNRALSAADIQLLASGSEAL